MENIIYGLRIRLRKGRITLERACQIVRQYGAVNNYPQAEVDKAVSYLSLPL